MAYYDQYLDRIKEELLQGRRQWKRGDKLLEAFGYMRRRQTAIDLIRASLEVRGLYTIPELTTSMPLDTGITFYLKGVPESEQEAPPNPESGEPLETVEVATEVGGQHEFEVVVDPPFTVPEVPADQSYVVANLACAERTPLSVGLASEVLVAMTRMEFEDYSQLVVVDDSRRVLGAISYKSIARASRGRGQPRSVADCLDTTIPKVLRSDPLLSVVGLFQKHDAVLVVRDDGSAAGIVTPSDIAVEFGAIAAPFLLIGEIEEELRWIIQKQLPNLESALAAVKIEFDPVITPQISDLTMGELQRLLQYKNHWDAIGISYDRRTFCDELNAVREIRNAVMHFREIEPEVLAKLSRFAQVLKAEFLAATKK